MNPGLDQLSNAGYPWEGKGALGKGGLFDQRQVQGKSLAMNSQQPTLWAAGEQVFGSPSGQGEGGD